MLVSILTAWCVVAVAVAIVLGRAAARGDREELGSHAGWDHPDVRAHLSDDAILGLRERSVSI